MPRRLISNRITFLLFGLTLSVWAPIVPLIALKFSLDEAELSLIILCQAGGFIMGMPLTAAAVRKFGNRNINLAAGMAILPLLSLITLAPTPVLLGILMFVLGNIMGFMDVSMNHQAIQINMNSRKSIIASVHGAFSVGCLLGAGGFSVFTHWGFSPFTCTLVVGLMVFGGSIATYPFQGVSDKSVKSEGFRFVVPPKLIIKLGLMCFVTFVAEGAMLDWSAIYIHNYKGFDITLSGLGFAAFSIAMASGRLGGDHFMSRYGTVTTVRLGSLLATTGMLVILFVPTMPATLFGFVIAGIGAANIVPALFGAAGHVRGISSASATSIITALGYSGTLIGPVIVGFLARQISLVSALTVVAVALLFVFVSANSVRSFSGTVD